MNNFPHNALGQQNIDLIAGVCGQFIRERYNAQLEDSTLRIILTNILRKQVDYYRANPPIPPLEELNKRAISEVRDFIIQQQRESQSQPQQPQSQQPQYAQPEQIFNPPPPPQVQQPQPQSQPQPHSQSHPLSQQLSQVAPQPLQSTIDFNEHLVNQEEHSIQDVRNEDDFFKKLQILEMQRQKTINIQQPPISDPVTGEGSQKVAPAPAQSTNTIIYMSPSTSDDLRHTHPIVLCGSERMWIHIPERNLLVFNGPLPDAMEIRLSRIMLPKRVSNSTPCVNIVIRSATDKNMEVLCHLDKEGPTWDIWKPVSRSLSLIKTFACPWTIILHDVFKRPLDMGKDGAAIISVKTLTNNNTKIIIESDIGLKSYGQILIQNEGTIHHAFTGNVFDNQVELIGDYSHIKLQDSYVCNLQAQAYIVFEMEKIEDTDNKI